MGTNKLNYFNIISLVLERTRLLASTWGVILGNSELRVVLTAHYLTQNPSAPLAVEQEVGGSSPPNCTT